MKEAAVVADDVVMIKKAAMTLPATRLEARIIHLRDKVKAKPTSLRRSS